MPTPVADENYNSPGTIGFIITFAIAVGAVFLFFDMNRRIRRTKYREEIREKLAQEELARPGEKPARPEPPAKPQR
jgi:HAMP domain-containing protein